MTGNEFRALRRKLALTQMELARALDVSRPTVSYYETGHARVPRAVELAIEALLNRSGSGNATIDSIMAGSAKSAAHGNFVIEKAGKS